MTAGGLRIVAGEWRGRKLRVPLGQTTRPTAARAREALFSMLVSRLGGLTGLHVADFYAGSGALGLEALSRGAAHCVFVERDQAALSALAANLDDLDVKSRAEMVRGSVEGCTAPRQPVHLAFFDPPYGSDELSATISQLRAKGWFASGAWISVETGHDHSLDPEGFTVAATRDIGKARITLLREQP